MWIYSARNQSLVPSFCRDKQPPQQSIAQPQQSWPPVNDYRWTRPLQSSSETVPENKFRPRAPYAGDVKAQKQLSSSQERVKRCLFHEVFRVQTGSWATVANRQFSDQLTLSNCGCNRGDRVIAIGKQMDIIQIFSATVQLLTNTSNHPFSRVRPRYRSAKRGKFSLRLSVAGH